MESGHPIRSLHILPYMSIDLFFVAAPFLCRTDEELRIFSRRVVAAILIAGVCFLAFPACVFAFPRPMPADGSARSLIGFAEMDSPFNLLPSLHAALLFSWSISTREIFAAFSCSRRWLCSSHRLSRCFTYSITSSTSSVFCPADIASTFFASHRSGASCHESPIGFRYYAAGATVVLFMGRSSGPGYPASLADDRARIVAIAYFERFDRFHKTKESCRGARGLCWRLVARSIFLAAVYRLPMSILG